MVNDGWQNGKCHRLGTCILMDMSLVGTNVHLPENRKVLTFIIFRMIRNVKDFMKPLLLILGSPNYSIAIENRIVFG